MNELKFRRKLERLEAVKQGKWRDTEGMLFDLYDVKQVADAYLERIILTCEKWENEDKTDIDNQIVSLLQKIRKHRDMLRNKTKNKSESTKNKTNKMKTEQLELTGLAKAETTQAAVAASVNTTKKEKPTSPQLYNVGQQLYGREIINVEMSVKGPKNGWVYTTKDLKTGKTERIKQSMFTKGIKDPFDYIAKTANSKKKSSKRPKTAKVKKEKRKITKFEETSFIRNEFPLIRRIENEDGSFRYKVDARGNKNFPNGEAEFFNTINAAFARVDEILVIMERNIKFAIKDADEKFEKAAAVVPSDPENASVPVERVVQEQPAVEPAPVVVAEQPKAPEATVKDMPFLAKLKILFS